MINIHILKLNNKSKFIRYFTTNFLNKKINKKFYFSLLSYFLILIIIMRIKFNTLASLGEGISLFIYLH